MITSMFCGDVCSEDFIKALGAERYGYKEEEGSVTDVGELVQRGVGISCLNLSCGYYEAHTDVEFTVFSELQNCFEFVCHIIDTLTDVYPHEYVGWASRYSYLERSPKHSGYKWGCDDDDWYWETSYDEDMDSMRTIVEYNEGISFDEIVGVGGFLQNFITRDIDLLRCMYDDAIAERYYEFDDDYDYEKDFGWSKGA